MITLNYTFNDLSIKLLSPIQEVVQNNYTQRLAKGGKTDFPFWTKVWASARGLACFLADHPHLIRNKNVLEIAGGLGLPSLLAAHFAASVCYSDYLPEPVEVVKQSAALNGLTNLTCRQLDWNHIPEDLAPDVLLLSDVNYNPSDFNLLTELFKHFIDKGTVIILSTPHRLMSKPFIEQLTPWQRMMEVVEVKEEYGITMISILVLATETKR